MSETDNECEHEGMEQSLHDMEVSEDGVAVQDDGNYAELDKYEMVDLAQNEGNMAAMRTNGPDVVRDIM
ncbi:hypothetical protein PInf_014432 [Phytophthora infestans]|nr:hypothetical protein PInf_014432 [Phytophthora infestans]